jgi:glycosyltransferase involved in cell wall biosynthesis
MENIHIAFVGVFTRYDDYCRDDQAICENTTYLGFQSDILAICEICDLYVNPRRSGGGTSCAEAMFMGLPVVTMNYGDVALAAGKDFIVETYAEMNQKIRRYANDKFFYAEMSKKARERAALLGDTRKSLEVIIDKAVSSPSFK